MLRNKDRVITLLSFPTEAEEKESRVVTADTGEETARLDPFPEGKNPYRG
jgi:hypothetical protein